jgi:hypothetical protein
VVLNLPYPTPARSMPTTGAGEIATILIQSIARSSAPDHLTTGTGDPVGYPAVLDAVDHAERAQPSSISRSGYPQALFPGINPLTYPLKFAAMGSTLPSSSRSRARWRPSSASGRPPLTGPAAGLAAAVGLAAG